MVCRAYRRNADSPTGLAYGFAIARPTPHTKKYNVKTAPGVPSFFTDNKRCYKVNMR